MSYAGPEVWACAAPYGRTGSYAWVAAYGDVSYPPPGNTGSYGAPWAS
ncbi:hypothetical protein ABZ990_07945 [Streptomyces sp. NPDC046203]